MGIFLPLALLAIMAGGRRGGAQTNGAGTHRPAPAPRPDPSPENHQRAAAAAAQAIATSRESGDPPEKQAAYALAEYLSAGGGSQVQVRELQTRMGMAREYITGLVGRYTRARATELGVELPPIERIAQAVRARTQ